MTRVMRHQQPTILVPTLRNETAHILSEPPDPSIDLGPSHEDRVFAAAVNIAKQDARWRKKLATELKDIAKQQGPGLPPRRLEAEMVVTTVDMLTMHFSDSKQGKTYEDGAFAKTAELLKDKFPGLNTGRAKALYYKFRDRFSGPIA